MTDTTAPRTAAADHVVAWERLGGSPVAHDIAEEGCEGCAFINRMRAEAIEPLLALVRALVRALEAAKVPHLVVDGDCWFSCGLAVDPYDGEPACCNDEERGKRCTCGADRHNAAIDRALADLPESVRVSARKPE